MPKNGVSISKRLGLVIAALIVALLAPLAPLAYADGLIQVNPAGANVYVKSQNVTVDIDNQIATTKVEQIFMNESNSDVEVVYLFPVPEKSAISDFAMWVDGKKLEAQVLNQQQARGIYEGIVRAKRDPALLEYAGQGVIKASIYPISPRSEKQIQFQYRQVLKAENGLADFSYPLSAGKFNSRPIQNLAVTINLRSKDGLKAIYSPTHTVAVNRKSANEATISFEQRNVVLDRDFNLYYSAAEGDFGLNFLTFKDIAEPSENPYFMMLVSPKVDDQTQQTEVVAKDVVLVVDNSGSMEGQKITQARQALLRVLDGLGPQDRFNIIVFNSTVFGFADGLQPISRRDEARNFVNRIRAEGGTDINTALQTALRQAQNDRQTNRPQTVIFVTDGQPTSGVTNIDQILSNTQKATNSEIRLFTFGVGFDVNTTLLDALASQNRGTADYVKPNEDVESKVAQLYSRISQPVLTNVSIEFSGLSMEDFYPQPLPDLFLGSQLVLTGRFKSRNGGSLPATTTATLKGFVNGRAVSIDYSNLKLESDDPSRSFIPRLWAGRKVGYLLTQIRSNNSAGGQRELVDQVTKLALKYGIVTPYTSFLVQEDRPVAPLPQGTFVGGSGTTAAAATTAAAVALGGADYQKSAAASVAAAATAAPASGAAAVDNSSQANNLANGNTVAAATTAAATTAASAGGQAPRQEAATGGQIKYVDTKTFILKNGIWTDTGWTGNGEIVKVPFNGDDYYKLLSAKPEWGKFFSVGEKVLVVLDGKAYQVIEAGAASSGNLNITPVATTPVANPTTVAVSATTPASTTTQAVAVGGPVTTIETGTPVANIGSNPATAPKTADNSGSGFGLIAVVSLLVVAGLGAGAFVLIRRRRS